MQDQGEHHPGARRAVSVGLYDIVFALNLASSFVYALRICVIGRFIPAPPDDLWYFFLRAAARINRALFLEVVSPVSTSDIERHMPGIREQVGRELVLLLMHSRRRRLCISFSGWSAERVSIE